MCKTKIIKRDRILLLRLRSISTGTMMIILFNPPIDLILRESFYRSQIKSINLKKNIYLLLIIKKKVRYYN